MRKEGLAVESFRKRFAVGVCLASMLVGLAWARDTVAQQGQGKYLTQASERLSNLIDKANADGYKLANNEFSIGGGWLKQGKEWVSLFAIPLSKEQEYRVLAAGDNDATDVDVQIVDANNPSKVLASDTATSAEAVVNFRPDTTQRYLIRVRVYASRNNLPAVCLGIILAK
jgi:hypothetical protein